MTKSELYREYKKVTNKLRDRGLSLEEKERINLERNVLLKQISQAPGHISHEDLYSAQV